MGLKSLFAPKQVQKQSTGADYIDLEEYTAGSEVFDATASMMVRVAEILKYDDLRDFANYVYQGNLLLLDFSAIAGDEIILRRVTGDLKKLVADINGDIAGLGKTMLIIAPTGVKIDRHKQRGAATGR
jgi:filamentous hemagglutinin family protein